MIYNAPGHTPVTRPARTISAGCAGGARELRFLHEEVDNFVGFAFRFTTDNTPARPAAPGRAERTEIPLVFLPFRAHVCELRVLCGKKNTQAHFSSHSLHDHKAQFVTVKGIICLFW